MVILFSSIDYEDYDYNLSNRIYQSLNISTNSSLFLAVAVKHLRYTIEYYPHIENNEPQGN